MAATDMFMELLWSLRVWYIGWACLGRVRGDTSSALGLARGGKFRRL